MLREPGGYHGDLGRYNGDLGDVTRVWGVLREHGWVRLGPGRVTTGTWGVGVREPVGCDWGLGWCYGSLGGVTGTWGV